ncbi:MAG TPA: THUMP domain-containing protein, partial [Candidatus Thermoplasmatota archaeon]|nr:THUMP domain-containing protein [Candidatus Thermoplasmatota archaeon]
MPALAPAVDPRPLLAPANVEAARRAQAELGLCDACLGRRFGKVETGLTNPERGRILRDAAGTPEASACWLCEGLLGELDLLADVAVKALEPYEHRHFLVGTRVDPEVERREAEANALLGVPAASAERIQAELNREVGKRVSARTGKPVEFKAPDLTVIVDTRFLDAELQHGGLHVFGRYRKLDRTIPQTRWPCRRCGGRGCVECRLTGKQYATSVEE